MPLRKQILFCGEIHVRSRGHLEHMKLGRALEEETCCKSSLCLRKWVLQNPVTAVASPSLAASCIAGRLSYGKKAGRSQNGPNWKKTYEKICNPWGLLPYSEHAPRCSEKLQVAQHGLTHNLLHADAWDILKAAATEFGSQLSPLSPEPCSRVRRGRSMWRT